MQSATFSLFHDVHLSYHYTVFISEIRYIETERYRFIPRRYLHTMAKRNKHKGGKDNGRDPREKPLKELSSLLEGIPWLQLHAIRALRKYASTWN